MSLSEMLLPEFDAEMQTTRQVLARVPDGKSTWKPHAKSMTLGRLATLIAELPQWIENALVRDDFDVAPPGGPGPRFAVLESTAQILELFDRSARSARAALASASDAEFAKPWSFKFGGRVVSTETKLMVYRRSSLNHLVHHRGQLTVYLRLNDVPVPWVYGPTADEPAF